MQVFTGRARCTAIVSALIVAMASLGCRLPYVGSPSVAIISKDPSHAVYEPIGGPIEHKACNWIALLVGGGEVATHESMIDRALEESGGDVLLDATLENWQLFLYLYARNCSIVRGQPARIVLGAQS
jgi:hypothetical protein